MLDAENQHIFPHPSVGAIINRPSHTIKFAVICGSFVNDPYNRTIKNLRESRVAEDDDPYKIILPSL